MLQLSCSVLAIVHNSHSFGDQKGEQTSTGTFAQASQLKVKSFSASTKTSCKSVLISTKFSQVKHALIDSYAVEKKS